MATNHRVHLPLLLALAACSGGGGSSSPGGVPPGTLQIVLDTASGSDAFVQVQVAAAALRADTGAITPNLLPAPQLLTIADPSGEPAGLVLRNVPAGSYRELHLAFAPGSAVAVLADGSRAGVDFPSLDVNVTLDSAVVQDPSRPTWLAMRHAVGASFQSGGNGRIAWTPDFAGGPAAGTSVQNATLRVGSVQGTTVNGSLAGTDDDAVHLECENETELFDDHGNHEEHGAFLAGLGRGHELLVSGVLDDHGGLRGQRVRHCSGGDGPRLLGRITSLEPGTATFGMDVFAEAERHGERIFLPAPVHVVVHVGNAPIHFSHTFHVLAFADLRVGDLAKVRWLTRSGSEVTAREIEIEGHGGLPANPEIQGSVAEVRLAERVIVVVPRHDDPLVVNGVSIARLEVHVTNETRIVRQDGSSSLPIELAGIVPLQDRIWIRGTVTGSASVDALWVRVRSD